MAQRTIPIAAGRLDGALNANSQKIVNLATPTANSDAATKQYVDEHGGGGGGAIDDVKVDGTSVVTNRVANIDLTGKASVSSLNAEVNRATAAEGTKASAASLTAETNRATAAEALKRDKTDFSISAPPSRYVVTVPQGGVKTDQSKWRFDYITTSAEPGYNVYYNEVFITFEEVSEHDELWVTIDDPDDPDYGKTYICTWTTFAADTIAKTSEVNAGLATKVQKPASETSADNGKYLQKTANGNVWATVQSGPSIVTSFPATPLDTNVPSTKLVKDSLDAKFDKTGGTIGSGNPSIGTTVTIGQHGDSEDPNGGYGELNVGGFEIGEGEGENGGGKINIHGNAELNVGEWSGCVIKLGSNQIKLESNHVDASHVREYGRIKIEGGTSEDQATCLTIEHTGSTDETLTHRIVRDANVDAKISADKTHAVSISATGVNPISPNASTGNVDVSTLFSGDNTSLVAAIDGELKADTSSVTGAANGSVLARIANLETQLGNIENALNRILGGN